MQLISEDYCVVSPAYGRDYRNKADATKAFLSGEDWVFQSIAPNPPRGTYCSVRDFEPGTRVEVRYKRLEMVTIVTVPS